MPLPEATPRHILPTDELIQTMLEELSSMKMANYSVDELVNLSVIALEEEDLVTDRISEFGNSVGRMCRIGLDQLDIDDQRILSSGWTKFTYGLFHIYKRMHMWDDNGFASYYVTGMLSNSVIVAEKPNINLPRG